MLWLGLPIGRTDYWPRRISEEYYFQPSVSVWTLTCFWASTRLSCNYREHMHIIMMYWVKVCVCVCHLSARQLENYYTYLLSAWYLRSLEKNIRWVRVGKYNSLVDQGMEGGLTGNGIGWRFARWLVVTGWPSVFCRCLQGVEPSAVNSHCCVNPVFIPSSPENSSVHRIFPTILVYLHSELTQHVLTMLGDLAVFWLYVILICSILHYITLTKSHISVIGQSQGYLSQSSRSLEKVLSYCSASDFTWDYAVYKYHYY